MLCTENIGSERLPEFGPATGLAWRPSVGNDRLVLRAGYGIFYDTSVEYYNSFAYNDNVFQSISATVYPQASGFEKLSPLNLNTLWLPNRLTQPGTALPPYLFAAGGNDWNFKMPRNQQWTADVQYAATPNLMFDVAYVGLRGSNEPAEWYFNGARLPNGKSQPAIALKNLLSNKESMLVKLMNSKIYRATATRVDLDFSGLPSKNCASIRHPGSCCGEQKQVSALNHTRCDCFGQRNRNGRS